MRLTFFYTSETKNPFCIRIDTKIGVPTLLFITFDKFMTRLKKNDTLTYNMQISEKEFFRLFAYTKRMLN